MMANSNSPSPLEGEGRGGGALSTSEAVAGFPPSLTLPLKGGGDRFASRLRQNADLSKTNWFRVGGPAEWLFRPEDTRDLSAFLSLLPADVPVTVLGVGSNVIVRDGGVEGVVIKLGRGFAGIEVTGVRCQVSDKEEDTSDTCHLTPVTLSIGAAALDINVANFARDHSLAGLEFLSGIPGTIGGAVRMNGGAYGADTSQVLVEAGIVERSGRIRILNNKELGFVYRNSALPDGAIVTHAVLQAKPGNPEDIRQRMEDINTAREETQPIRSRTGGSTFKNPEGHKAWELIDKAGCRGLMLGAAQVSEKHCNFLINTGDATASNLEALGEEVRRRVKEKTGIMLEWEIKRIGKG